MCMQTAVETRHGVAGYRSTQDAIESVYVCVCRLQWRHVMEWLDTAIRKMPLRVCMCVYAGCSGDTSWSGSVSYTHLTLPTNREV